MSTKLALVDPPPAALETDDDFDWQDLEQPHRGRKKPAATVMISKGQKGDQPGRAYITLRHEPAQWLHQSQFHRIQVGGQNANYLRLLPEKKGRPYSIKGGSATIIAAGIVTAWPDEARAAVECTWKIMDGFLLLGLPISFAKPTPQAKTPIAVAKPAPEPEKTTLSAAAIASLVAERDEAVEQLQQQQEGHRRLVDAIPKDLGGPKKLTPIERTVIALLISRPRVSREALMVASAKPGEDDNRDDKLADVVISRLRPKLAYLSVPGGIPVEIATDYSEGYHISDALRGALRRMWAPTAETV